MTEGLAACQELVKVGTIASYGIASNGLSLQATHPLHLSWWDTVLPTTVAAAAIPHEPLGNDWPGRSTSNSSRLCREQGKGTSSASLHHANTAALFRPWHG